MFLRIKEKLTEKVGGNEFPEESNYENYLAKLFTAVDIWSRKTIFMFFPRNFYFSRIMEKFDPDLVISDVIDDQRYWPGNNERKRLLTENYKTMLDTAITCFNALAQNYYCKQPF